MGAKVTNNHMFGCGTILKVDEEVMKSVYQHFPYLNL